METYEQQWRADFSRCVISLMSAVLEELAQEFGRMRISRARAVWSSDASFRKRAQHCIGREIIELEVFLGRTLPVFDVRLVPDFPQPGFHFRVAVTRPQVTSKLKNQLRPFGVIPRRVGPTGINRTDRTLRKIMAIRFGMRGKRFGHEANFDDGPDAGRVKRIEDMIDDRPAVNRVTVLVFS